MSNCKICGVIDDDGFNYTSESDYLSYDSEDWSDDETKLVTSEIPEEKGIKATLAQESIQSNTSKVSTDSQEKVSSNLRENESKESTSSQDTTELEEANESTVPKLHDSGDRTVSAFTIPGKSKEVNSKTSIDLTKPKDLELEKTIEIHLTKPMTQRETTVTKTDTIPASKDQTEKKDNNETPKSLIQISTTESTKESKQLIESKQSNESLVQNQTSNLTMSNEFKQLKNEPKAEEQIVTVTQKRTVTSIGTPVVASKQLKEPEESIQNEVTVLNPSRDMEELKQVNITEALKKTEHFVQKNENELTKPKETELIRSGNSNSVEPKTRTLEVSNKIQDSSASAILVSKELTKTKDLREPDLSGISNEIPAKGLNLMDVLKEPEDINQEDVVKTKQETESLDSDEENRMSESDVPEESSVTKNVSRQNYKREAFSDDEEDLSEASESEDGLSGSEVEWQSDEEKMKTLIAEVAMPGKASGTHKSHQHQSGQRRQYRRHRKQPMSRVTMPSGKKFFITKPKEPNNWSCKKNTNMITLNPTGKMGAREHRIVAKEMANTRMAIPGCAGRGGCYSGFNIVKIQKLVNPCLWKRYRMRQRDIAREIHFKNERMLFHGSSKAHEIAGTGFDERYSNPNGVFGAGLYFAHNSTASDEYTYGVLNSAGCPLHKLHTCFVCERKMLLCRVTLGKEYKKDGGQRLAHPPVGFHSAQGKNGANSYMEYVIYRGEQAYPEYLITYKIVP